MVANSRTTHLGRALRWSAAHDVPPVQIIAAAIGMAAPVGLGAIQGHLALGLAAALGGLFVSDVRPGPNARAYLRRLVPVLMPAAAAALAAALAAGRGWISDALVVVLAAAAATAGGYSRGLAAATMRFVLFLVLAVGACDVPSPAARVGLLVVILTGALAAAAMSLLLGLLPGAHRRAAPESGDDAGPHATAAQKLARWQRTLSHRAGWQYALRLAACLAVAGLARSLWPDHHLRWIAVVIAILTQRQIEPLSIKTTQRALGTLAGVAAASLFVAHRPAVWGLVIGIAVLAGLRPLLKARNYLVYSGIMTPLIVLLLGTDHPLGAGVLMDRLIATLAGAALVVASSFAAAFWIRSTSDTR